MSRERFTPKQVIGVLREKSFRIHVQSLSGCLRFKLHDSQTSRKSNRFKILKDSCPKLKLIAFYHI